MSFGGGDNFYTKSPLSPPLSLPFSFHSSPQETPSSFRLSSIIGEEFLTPGPWVENYPTKEIKWRGYIVFFSFPSLHPRPFPLRTYVDQMMKRKKKKKKRRKNRTRLLIMRVEEISFCQASTRLFLWKKAFLLCISPR